MMHSVEISTSAIGHFVYHGTYYTILGEYLDAVAPEDYSKATDAIGELAVEVIRDAFSDIIPSYDFDIDNDYSMEYQDTYHPSYYNFETDNVIFTFNYSDNLKTYLYCHAEANKADFEYFLEKHYTSRDGFISFTPNNWGEWLEGWNDDEWKCVSALLRFFIEDSFSESEIESWEYDFNDNARTLIEEQYTPWKYAVKFDNGFVGCVYSDYDENEGCEVFNAYLIDDNENVVNHIKMYNDCFYVRGAYDAWGHIEYDLTDGYKLCGTRYESCKAPKEPVCHND